MDLKDAPADGMSDIGELNAVAAPLARVTAFADAPVASGSKPPAVEAQPDDAALMLRYRNGDLQAFEMLYRRHKGALYRYLQRLCRSRDVADDLFQEVWGKVIASRERYEVRAQFNTFLFRIAHNCAVDYFRRAGRQRIGQTDDVMALSEELPGSDVLRPDVAAAESELRRSFKQALEQLPAEQRDVFLLYEESGLNLEEIGKITGVAMETAKSRLRYALGKLRTALQPYHSPAQSIES
jgi:RNA polymerase sigma-70 factor, ECF subfamily